MSERWLGEALWREPKSTCTICNGDLRQTRRGVWYHLSPLAYGHDAHPVDVRGKDPR